MNIGDIYLADLPESQDYWNQKDLWEMKDLPTI